HRAVRRAAADRPRRAAGPSPRPTARWPACQITGDKARSRSGCLARDQAPEQATFAREARRFRGFERRRDVGQRSWQASFEPLIDLGTHAAELGPGFSNQAARVVAESLVKVRS